MAGRKLLILVDGETEPSVNVATEDHIFQRVGGLQELRTVQWVRRT